MINKLTAIGTDVEGYRGGLPGYCPGAFQRGGHALVAPVQLPRHHERGRAEDSPVAGGAHIVATTVTAALGQRPLKRGVIEPGLAQAGFDHRAGGRVTPFSESGAEHRLANRLNAGPGSTQLAVWWPAHC